MLLEVGHIGRAHGLTGEVVVELVSNVEDRVAAGRELLTEEGRTLRVRSSSLLPGRAGTANQFWLVSFVGVEDRDAAEQLRGCVLRGERGQRPDGLWVDELIGSTVHDSAGEPRGRVVSVEANPASDLLVLDSGALVPLRFVVSSQGGDVVVEAPEGLFDL